MVHDGRKGAPARRVRSGRRKLLGGWLGITLIVLLVGAMLASVGAAWWLNRPLPLAGEVVEVSIERGTPPRAIAQAWVDAGVLLPPELLFQWFRLSGQAREIRAGSYAVNRGDTARDLLAHMVQGRESLEPLRLIEGWTFKQVREALARAPGLRQTLAGVPDADVMRRLGLGGADIGATPEGWLFPDTYLYGKGVSDDAVLRRAHAAMQRQLEQVWQTRDPNLPLKSPQELLVLASIVEKETGRADERRRIASVFVNRLRLGMPLQTDPTVIYGLGEAFDGNLRKVHLQTDGPYNTYTRRGLPPTPIAMPGLASLRAAAQPENTQALYFVARGDGSSEFSTNLADHNRAVDRYQRRR